MRLTVKARIATAMAILMLVNAAGAVITWRGFATAAQHSASAQEAFERARSAEVVATRLTQYVADSRALALAVSRSTLSEDSSVAYGRLQGSESGVDSALRALAGKAGGDAEALATDWDALRVSTYLWINREAATADSPFRLTADAKGRYRASVASNVREPSQVAAMSDSALRREVRDASETFTNATLRTMVESAEKDAALAAALEESVRNRAIWLSIALAVFSLAAAVLSGTWLYRSIAVPLGQARSFADRVAGGDLAATFPQHRSDEIGALTREIEHMKDVVVRRIATMREMAGAVLITAEAVRAEAVALDVPEVAEGTEVLLGLAGQMLED